VRRDEHPFWYVYAKVVERPLIWLRDALTFLLQRLLYEEPTFAEVRASKYRPHTVVEGARRDLSLELTADEIAESTAHADALLALAERVASETDDRSETVQAKARFQLTLCGLLLAAIWSLSDAPLSTPAAVAGLAFVAALFLLLRVLQTGSTSIVQVRRDVFDATDGDQIKRYHASRLFKAAAENDGRLDFLVGVQRAAARAIHIGLIAVVWLGVSTVLGATDASEEPTDSVTLADDPDLQATMDSLVEARVRAALDTLPQIVRPGPASTPEDTTASSELEDSKPLQE